MQFRLDVQHYIHDRLLEPGHIIGDGTDVPFRNKDGSPMTPSVGMTPVDAEGADHFKAAYPGAQLPERDPTKAIPIRGTSDTAMQPPLVTKNADGTVRQPGGPVDVTDGGHVIGPDGKPTNELKHGLPDSGSPNSPVGRPVIGTLPGPGETAHAPPPPEDPALRVNAPAAEQQAVTDAQRKAQADAAAKAGQPAPRPATPAPAPVKPSDLKK